MTFYENELRRIKKVVYKNQKQIDAVISVRNYIDAHYESSLNLNRLSETQFVSKFHLLRLFKKYYGVTPKQYLVEKRIRRSKQLLKEGMSVTECCLAVGFTSLGSYSTLFKRKTGKTPAQFQKEQFSRRLLAGEP